MINPMMGQGAQPIEGDRLEMVKQQADLDGPLVDYKAKGTTIEVQGVETVDGKKVHKLKVTPKTGRPVTLYLDAETGLEAKTVMEAPADAAGPGAPAATLESVFSNYQTVGKLTMPHTIQQKANGQVLQINIDKIELSPASVDDSLFAMPSGRAGGAEAVRPTIPTPHPQSSPPFGGRGQSNEPSRSSNPHVRPCDVLRTAASLR